MRNLFVAISLMMGASALLATPVHAGPGQALKGDWAKTQGQLQTVGYLDRAERRLRRNGYTVIPPGPPAAAPVVVGDAAIVPATPVVPVRPTTCGEYHYWNGVACVDARYEEEPETP